ncbi:VanZ family protein [Paenibacillus psychroresistens]|uniref:VanZ family protein n=1 Tax=Paenibacillus psychroresistens TaxID=1778678 RepID=A0A6B8RLY7_9BACL|nr:VanZ family protein [Paenibacillus psychroresistens]QGQ97411.1 VanZ family protein [Paenibacillus psychroresistens]
MNNNLYSNKRLSWIRAILALALVGWMALIYLKSNEPYQTQDIRPLLTEWFPAAAINYWLPHLEFNYSGQLITWKEPYAMLEFFLRKSAHVLEYALLTGLWFSNLQWTRFKYYSILLSPILAVLYAITDEWHQSFIAGRTGHAIDVAVDSIGCLIVIMLIWLFRSRRNINRGVKRS